MDKKKIIASFAAAVAIASFATKGTFSWTAISQRVLNEGSVVLQPGGRIHDDFEGFDDVNFNNTTNYSKLLKLNNDEVQNNDDNTVNKDIYAENYSNKPLYVRVKLSEYLEIGTGAGQYQETTLENSPEHIMVPKESNHAKTITGGGMSSAKLNDRSSWPTILPNEKTTDEQNDATARKYVTLNWGDKNSIPKVYMPTFNQDNNDLSADVTGDAIDEKTWKKNLFYDTDSNPKVLNGKQDQWTIDETYKSTLKYFDEKTKTQKDISGVEHKAKQTLKPDNNGYMTMEQWVQNNKPTGNFWVHDEDGWAYWANPLQQNQASALLLDDIKINLPQDDMYYAINVTADFATEDQTDLWEGTSENANLLLNAIKNNN